MKNGSRRSRRIENQSKKQLRNSLLGTALVIFILLTFGPYVIGFMGGIVDTLGSRGGNDIKSSTETPIQQPILDPLPDATPSSSIKVTGQVFSGEGIVELFLNNAKYDDVKIDNSNEFKFDNVRLVIGENNIKARVNVNGKLSDFTQESTVLYIKDAPELEVVAPSDNATFGRGDQEVVVRGKTDLNNSVTVNGFRAIVDSEGKFSYTLSLSEGENKIKIIATNPVNKTTEKEITVKYSP